MAIGWGKGLDMRNCVTILSVMLFTHLGMDQERVMYIPGWHRCGRGEDEALCAVRKVFPEAEVSVRNWDGNCVWRKAKDNADAEAKRLAAELMALTDDERSRLTLVGHSLGARIVVRALALLGEKGSKVKKVAVLAAAVPCDDPDVTRFTAACESPALIVCNPKDTMLKYVYRPFGGEGAKALGAVGPAMPLANCHVRVVAPGAIQSTPLDAFWAKSGWVRMAAAHYAPFYIREIGIHEEKP